MADRTDVDTPRTRTDVVDRGREYLREHNDPVCGAILPSAWAELTEDLLAEVEALRAERVRLLSGTCPQCGQPGTDRRLWCSCGWEAPECAQERDHFHCVLNGLANALVDGRSLDGWRPLISIAMGLRDRVAKLEEALRPFAEVGAHIDECIPGDSFLVSLFIDNVGPTVDDVAAARAALEESD